MGKSSPFTFSVMIRQLLVSYLFGGLFYLLFPPFICIYFCRLIKLILLSPFHLVNRTSLVIFHSLSSYSLFPVAHNQIRNSLPQYENQMYISPTKILYSSTTSTPNFRIFSLPPPVPQPLPRWDLWNTSLLSTHPRCPDLLRFAYYF